MKSLVTGASGLIGGYLVEHLLECGDAVTACDTVHFPDAAIECLPLDVLNRTAVHAVLEEQEPDVIYHLAAQSLPDVSWEDPAPTYRVNVIGTVNVLEAVKNVKPGAKVVIACSSGAYAPVREETPITEDYALDPSSPYGVSKFAVDTFAGMYAERHGLKIVRARPFYLVGPRKKGDVCSDFARGILAVERGEAKDVPVGNLDVIRDIMDVRDGVAALRVLALEGEAGGVYNVCCGQGVSIGDVFNRLAALSSVDVEARPDPQRQRKIDEPVKIGDASKLKALGWQPRYDLETTLADIMAYWREQ
jgi:GDP-4-dehydro-6-deoxy-D-mannose reductase